MDRRGADTDRTNSADSARAEVEALRAALAAAEAKVSDAQVQIAALKLMIECCFARNLVADFSDCS